jgi:hypothetical protein
MTPSIARFRGYGAVLLLALFVVACVPFGQRAEREDVPPTTVEVDNQGFLDANIYVMRGAQRIRLGTVPGASRRVLTIPSHLIFGGTPISFRAEPIGSRAAPISQEIVVFEGDQVRLVLRGW